MNEKYSAQWAPIAFILGAAICAVFDMWDWAFLYVLMGIAIRR